MRHLCRSSQTLHVKIAYNQTTGNKPKSKIIVICFSGNLREIPEKLHPMKTAGNFTSHSITPRGFGKPTCCFVFLFLMMGVIASSHAQDQRVIRLAKLTIDPQQLEYYRVALKEHIETALRVEPGVLTLYAVADKNDPAQITVFEIYADEKAYASHVATTHFKKYKSTTKDMVKALTLIDTVPIAVNEKPGN